MDDRALLDSEQAAAYLLVSMRTLRRWRETSRVPFIRLPSGNIRYDADQLAKWLDKHNRGASA